nr:SDR family NAD(P)-dependent oxidoreductase [Desertimonas flava]
MATILITGGAGFIGCRLSVALLAAGDDVAVLDNLHPQVHPTRTVPRNLPDEVRFVPGDVAAASSWAAVLATVRPDAIVHLAAETGTGQSLTEPTRHANVNVLGTAAMLEALEHSPHRPGHIVLASSRAVYGDGAWITNEGTVFYPGQRSAAQLDAGRWDHSAPDGSPARPIPSVAGITVPEPTNIYAATKLAQEHLLRSWTQARQVDLSILRLQNVYGPGQSVTNSYTGVLTFFARTALEGRVIDVYEDGEIVRDFVFVDDVASALAASVRRPANRLVDIGSGRPTTIGAVARIVAEACAAPPPVVSGRYRHGDVRAASCNIDTAAGSLGYEPTKPLTDGIAAVLDWMPTAAEFRAR